MTKDEKNRKIAEWLCFRVTTEAEVDNRHQFFTWHAPNCACPSVKPESICSCVDLCSTEPPDFFIDEAANALILDRMLERFSAVLSKDYIRFEPLLGRYYEGTGDRKTAICEAALKVIDTLKES